MFRTNFIFPIIFFLILACKEKSLTASIKRDAEPGAISYQSATAKQDSGIKTIHVFVALCDNKYQGIVPVPAAIGNGQDPKNNLYWGAGYGVKSYFINKNKDWQLISTKPNPAENILERLLFKHRTKDIYMLADAYNGKFIRQTTIDFLNASSGKNEIAIETSRASTFPSGGSRM